MTEEQWKVFCKFKKELKSKVEEWAESAPALSRLQREAALAAKTPLYPFETTVVYNRALDDLTPEDQIKLIVIGDNPGKDEQLAKNNRYLVGQAGKIAEGYFRRNPELGVDFRKNVIILNKTPVHSAKTNQLKQIARKLQDLSGNLKTGWRKKQRPCMQLWALSSGWLAILSLRKREFSVPTAIPLKAPVRTRPGSGFMFSSIFP